jgi:hypothetical protein
MVINILNSIFHYVPFYIDRLECENSKYSIGVYQ